MENPKIEFYGIGLSTHGLGNHLTLFINNEQLVIVFKKRLRFVKFFSYTKECHKPIIVKFFGYVKGPIYPVNDEQNQY